MKKKLNSLLEAGVYNDLPEGEKKRIRLLNRLIFLSVLVMLVFSVLDAVNGYYQMLAIGLVVCLAAWAQQMLVRSRRYTAAKHLVFFLILATVTFTAIFVGDSSGTQYMLVPVTMIPLLIFSSRTTAAFLFFLVLGFYVLVYYLQQRIEPLLVLPGHLVPVYTITATFCMMGITYMFTSYARSVNESYEELILNKTDQLVAAYKDITDSITYARRIQHTILPSVKTVRECLPDSFILYKPQSIVAGDFYWVEREGGKIFFSVADCTGHGVPGAMVSVMCSNALKKAVKETGICVPAKILDRTVQVLQEQFEKSELEVQDGMDLALCAFDPESSVLEYAGAHNPLCLVRNGELTEIKADKQPVGKYAHRLPFTNHALQLQKGDCLYLFSDGYADQFGGDKGKKFKQSQLRALLLSVSSLPMQEQKDILEETFETWRGSLEQVDDVCVMGVRV